MYYNIDEDDNVDDDDDDANVDDYVDVDGDVDDVDDGDHGDDEDGDGDDGDDDDGDETDDDDDGGDDDDVVWSCAVGMHTDISQEPFCVNIYTENGRGHLPGQCFLRACAVEMRPLWGISKQDL